MATIKINVESINCLYINSNGKEKNNEGSRTYKRRQLVESVDAVGWTICPHIQFAKNPLRCRNHRLHIFFSLARHSDCVLKIRFVQFRFFFSSYFLCLFFVLFFTPWPDAFLRRCGGRLCLIYERNSTEEMIKKRLRVKKWVGFMLFISIMYRAKFFCCFLYFFLKQFTVVIVLYFPLHLIYLLS